MNTVIRHIEYLISRTECVIIPGLGALLARYEDASICLDSLRYMPPKRVFSFNSSITASDGALACSIARAQGIAFEAAQDIVKTEVEAMKRQLALQGRLSLGRAGYLELDAESGAPLYSDYGVDLLSVDTAWLPVVEAAAVAAPRIQPEHSAEQPARRRTPKARPYLRIAKAAASIAMLVGIAIVASTPIAVDDATLASLYPEIKTASAEGLMPASPIDGQAEELDDAAYLSEVSDDAACVDEAPELAIINNCDYPMGPDMGPEPCYLVIVGSFSTEAEANRHIAANAGQRLKIFAKDGRYRVYSQAFETEQQAYAAISKMPQGTGAWVCKR